MRGRIGVLWASLGAALVGLAGCGGDGKTTTDSGALDSAEATDVTETSRDANEVVATEVAGDGTEPGEVDNGDGAQETEVAETTPTAREQVLAVPEKERWTLAGLHHEVQVVRTESNIPFVHAADEHDLYFAHGFVVARDRFLMMDIIRRAATGRLSEILGDLGLARDIEGRGVGLGVITDRLLAGLQAPERARVDAFIAGINAYIGEVRAGRLPVPPEYVLMGPVLGASTPADLLAEWVPRDATSVAAFAVYYASFESGDVGNAASLAKLDDLFQGAPMGSERTAGLTADIWENMKPLHPTTSAPGFGLEVGPDAAPAEDPTKQRAATFGAAGDRARPAASAGHGARKRAPQEMLDRAAQRLAKLQLRLLRDKKNDFGSNGWAVMGKHGKDGITLLAADGHLDLDVPSFFFQIGLDTSVFGDGVSEPPLRQKGLVIPGVVQLAVGTNGSVAWTQTQESGDITDWYQEEVHLDANGLPFESKFKGQWKPLVAAEESYVIRDIPIFDSIGRTETWKRWQTFDGRWLADIEGRTATRTDPLAAGEALVTMQGDLIIPGDTNHDGVVSAISFDYTGLDIGNLLKANQLWGTSKDVWDFLDAMRYVTTYSQNMIGADKNGNVVYSGYQSVPCRAYLPRDANGKWIDGADPRLLLDGNEYPAFTIPVTADGAVDEGPGKTDPTKCVVPFDRYPQSISPEKGYVVTANNDIGGIITNGEVYTDEYYLGGPWDIGYRASSIAAGIEQAMSEGSADVAKMAEIQATHKSRIAEDFLDLLLPTLDRAEANSDPLYTNNQARLVAARARLVSWKAHGFHSESGVETFYHQVGPNEREDAVATSIFWAWFTRVVQGTFNDEGIPGDVWQNGSDMGHVRLLHRMLLGRGPGNTQQLASWVEATGESAYFDTLQTQRLETSDIIVLEALIAGLDFLKGPGGGDEGGFGTDDMSQWVWGLRHQVHFGSLLANQIGNNPLFEAVLGDFRITTDRLPLASNMAADDPRKGLTWFPRPGDQWNVDAANPGYSGTHFGHGAGPVMRMVIGFTKDGHVTGQNIIPGGQSGDPASAFFDDQARLWLGNRALPLRYEAADEIAGAVGREVLTPAQSQ